MQQTWLQILMMARPIQGFVRSQKHRQEGCAIFPHDPNKLGRFPRDGQNPAEAIGHAAWFILIQIEP
jgi:hypothetical protein